MPPKKNPITKKKGRVATPPTARRAPAPPPESPKSSPKPTKKQPVMQTAAEALSQANYVGMAPATGHAIYSVPPAQAAAAGGYMDMSGRFGKKKTPPPRRKATDKLPTPPPKRKGGKK